MGILVNMMVTMGLWWRERELEEKERDPRLAAQLKMMK